MTSDDYDSAQPLLAHNRADVIEGIGVQAGVIQGGVHVHPGPTVRLPPPRQLPVASPRFVNRRAELAVLQEALNAGRGRAPTVVMVSGLAGVGKSALATAALTLWTPQFPDGQLYADLAGPGEVSPGEVLGRFLRALGVPLHQVPDGEAKRAALWRSATAHRHVAVLLEAPTSVQQVRPLLPTSPNSVTLITGRRSMTELVADGAVLVMLEPLDRVGALELLRRHLDAHRITAQTHALEELGQLCGGLPLALTVAAAHAATRPRRPLSHTVTALRNAYCRLEVVSVDSDHPAQASLDAAYRDLSEPSASAYRLLGLSPGLEICVELAAAALDATVATAMRRLEELVDASLLLDLDGHCFRFHDLVHVHARRTAETHDGDAARADATHRMVRWYLLNTRAAAATVLPARRELPWIDAPTAAPYVLDHGHDDYASALRWLDRERRTIGAAAREALTHGWPDLTILLADALQPGVIIHKDYAYTVQVDEIALQAAQRLGDHSAEHTIRKRLARALIRLGDLARARTHVDQSLQDARTRDDRAGLASAVKSHALLSLACGHTAAAVQAFLEVATIHAELDNPRAEGLVLIDLGNALLDLGRPEVASPHLHRARTLQSTLATPDRYNTARAEISLAHADLLAGDPDPAHTLATTALTTMTQLSAFSEQARAHEVLAAITERAGHRQRADHHRAHVEALRTGLVGPRQGTVTTSAPPLIGEPTREESE